MAVRTTRVGSSEVAIIGAACRFPGGVTTPEGFWDLLSAGKDAVTQVPDDRFDKRLFYHPGTSVAGHSYTFSAGTLGDVSGFDPGFFGISPREADQMDPQQRLLLEMTWEAMERGGLVPEHLAGTQTAVYIGISSTDYAGIRMADPESGDAYFMLGSTLSIAANRISYVFDLHGPSMAIDTACSSSVVALHEAVRTLREGRCGMAVVGGMHLVLSPYNFVGFSKATMLAPYGRCRAFDKVAKGYVRAEGGGIILLKPLADAERDGDPILGIVRGVNINTDGRTRGIALPSSERQEELLRRAYAEAGVAPDEVAYVEMHGTGTAVGDPAECGAVGRALGKERSDGPLTIGSVKSNIGHLEPAAGIAGILKALLVLRHGVIPPTLHVETPNPDIDFTDLNLSIAREARPLLSSTRPAVVGVNSFGFGGTNAHVILQEYRSPKTTEPASSDAATPSPLYLSARSVSALRDLARATAQALITPDAPDHEDAAWTLARRRTHHQFRLVARGATALADLRAFAEGAAPPTVVSGAICNHKAPVGLIFSGNGSQWSGMGAMLLGHDPVFTATIETIDALVRQTTGWSVLEEMRANADPSRMDDTRIAQPMLFALQVAIVESLRARGVCFSAVTGHSVGEVAAAWAAGALPLEDAVHLILKRSAAQHRTRGLGRMAAVDLSKEAATRIVASHDGRVEVAAINGPKSVTLSGDEASLRALEVDLRAAGVYFKMLDLDYAFHSQVLDLVQEDLARALATLHPRPTRKGVSFYSTVTGSSKDGDSLTAGYWWDNVRLPVRFRDAVAAMSEDGIQVFLEIGPHPIMQSYIRQTLQQLDAQGQPMHTLTRQMAGPDALDVAADRVHILGGSLDFEALFPGRRAVADLPTYPWQRERHWFRPTSEARGRIAQWTEGPLLGSRPLRDVPLWETLLDCAVHPFLADHVIGGSILFPAAGFLEMALEAGAILFQDERVDVEHLNIWRPLVLEPDHPKLVRFIWDAEDGMFRIESRRHMKDEAWSVHVTGRLTQPQHEAPGSDPAFDAWSTEVNSVDHYAMARAIGLDYGPAFQTVQRVSVCGDTAVAELTLPDDLPEVEAYRLPPPLLDGALQALLALTASTAGFNEPVTYLPHQVGRFLLHGRATRASRCVVTLTRRRNRSITADVVMTDAEGIVLAEARGFRFQRALLSRRGTTGGMLHRSERTPLPLLIDAPAVKLSATRATEVLTRAAGRATSSAGSMLDRVAAAFAHEALEGLPDSDVPINQSQLLATCRALVVDHPSVEKSEAVATWQRALAACPDHLAELALIGRAGRTLRKVLTSEAMPMPASSATLEHLADSAPTLAGADAALAEAIAAVLADRPSDRRLQILEVGAGTGGLTRRLLAALPADGVTLMATDADADALTHVLTETGYDPRLDVGALNVLDVLNDPGSEWAASRFDIVVASGLLRSLSQPIVALEAMARLAAPGGLVLLAEAAPAAWLDLAFGFDPKWWSREDNGVPLPPLMDRQTLEDIAKFAGLTDVSVQTVGAAQALVARSAHDQAAPAQPSLAEGACWLVTADDTGPEAALAKAVAAALRARGATVTIIAPHENRVSAGHDTVAIDFFAPEAWASVFKQLRPNGVVHLFGFGDTATEATALVAAQTRRCWSLTALAQGARSVEEISPRLYIAAVDNGDDAGMVEGAIGGLARVLQNEALTLRPTLISLENDDPATLAEVLAAEVLANCSEQDVILGRDRRFGRRVRSAQLDLNARAHAEGAETRQTLSFSPGSLDNLHWVEERRREPEAGEVEIKVAAAGLNFRDVMFALGILPDEAVENGFAGATTGMEASGVVTRVGPGVDHLAVGDAVLCFAPQCFSTHVTTAVTAVAPKPYGLGFEAAATVPTVFFTVYYALHHLARLEPGERLLVHGGAGGIGLAAIQFARHIGAEVYTTVGTREKHDIAVLAGVPEERIFDSRSTAFADQIMAVTRGHGVDVVLNSLAGEALHKSLTTLRPFGRFLELGKRDFFANSRIGLRPFRNNISYYGIDADQLMVEKPALARRLFQEMTDLFEQGVFAPLPYRTFPAARAVQAFRHMQQSRHIGKIILTPPSVPEGSAKPVEDVEAAPATLELSAEGTYLVTGGLGGFGLRTAEWLAEKGAQHLVLVSRRGVVEDDDVPTINDLRDRGVTVDTRACDVSNETAVVGLVAEYPKLKGVVHAAAVYDDGVIGTMAAKRFTDVLAPKAGGAWALHKATAGHELDFFIVYSSVTTLLGNPGQANYVAANQSLESLIAYRRKQGLPGMAVCWGGISDTGYLARNIEVQKSLENRQGVTAMTSAEALVWLEKLLVADCETMTIAPLDWRFMGGSLPSLRSPRFRELRRGAENYSESDHADLGAMIRDMTPEEVRDLVVEMLTDALAKVLRIRSDRIDQRISIFDLGVDSLMALELNMMIEKKFGVSLPPAAISEGATLLHVAERIRDQILGNVVGIPAADDEITRLVQQHAAEDINLDPS